jgi:hypothetical protein
MQSNTCRSRLESTSQLLHRASTVFAQADEDQEQFRHRLEVFEQKRKEFRAELERCQRENIWLAHRD